MLQFLSKESEIGTTMLRYLQLKRDFHEATAKQISEKMEHYQRLLAGPTVASPVFGCGLDEHLKKQGHGVCIALPIRSCVCRLLQMNAEREEEGIFRVASSTLKIRRLAALFDTGEASDASLLEIQDAHVFSGALKLYLRELPVPLLGSNYQQWLIPSQQHKKESIDSLLSGLSQNHRHNLHYLLKFFQLVASHSSVNKMTIANISIVLAPSLLWDVSTEASDSRRDLSDTTAVNDIVEMLITHVDYFFRGFGPGNVDFFKEVTLEKPPHLLVKAKQSSSSSEESVVDPSRTTPIPKPRQSRAANKPPPLAPRPPLPADRSSIQSNASSTHL